MFKNALSQKGFKGLRSQSRQQRRRISSRGGIVRARRLQRKELGKNRKIGMEDEVKEISSMVGVMRKWATTEDEEQQEKENK